MGEQLNYPNAKARLLANEAKYHDLFMAIDEGFCTIQVIFDTQGKAVDYRFLEANPAFERQTGLIDAVGRTVREMVPAHEEHWFETYGKVAQSGEAIRFSARAVALGRFYDVYAFSEGERTDNIVAVLFTDISDKKRIEEERDRLNQALSESNSELLDFAHVVSHDLQAPLRTIRIYSELLAAHYGENLDRTAGQILSTISDGIQNMEQLIHGLLELAQVGDDRAGRATIDAESVLAGVVATLRPGVQETQAEVTWEALPEVYVNRLQLAQLFQNLIGNALKYRDPARPPRIHVRAECQESHYTFAVSDNGIGIEDRHRERIFAPLTRLHGSQIPGVGIGLAICKKIVERHGGRIWVESKVGTGTTFFFTLPR